MPRNMSRACLDHELRGNTREGRFAMCPGSTGRHPSTQAGYREGGLGVGVWCTGLCLGLPWCLPGWGPVGWSASGPLGPLFNPGPSSLMHFGMKWIKNKYIKFKEKFIQTPERNHSKCKQYVCDYMLLVPLHFTVLQHIICCKTVECKGTNI